MARGGAPPRPPGPRPRVKELKAGRVVTNALGTGGAAKPRGYASFIEFWRDATNRRAPQPCFAVGCRAPATGGGHIKLAGSALTAALHFDWWVVPACAAHNKRSSCGSYQVKAGTLAVCVAPSLGERLASYGADGRKLVAAALGKHHL